MSWCSRCWSLGEAEELADWYIGLNKRIATKLKAGPYKPLDRDGATLFFKRFLEEQESIPFGEQAARLLSGLAFGQFMPNANHRAAISLVTVWLGLNGVDLSRDKEFDAKASTYVLKSKEDIERAYRKAEQFHGSARQSYLWEKYWPGHLRSTHKFLKCLSPIDEAVQSGKWGKTPLSHLKSLLAISSGEA